MAISEIQDLEDHLQIFQEIVEKLSVQSEIRAVIHTVKFTQNMSEYIIVQDKLLQGIKSLSCILKDPNQQNQLLNLVSKFNNMSCDFQDTWTDQYWKIYKNIRNSMVTGKLYRISRQNFSHQIAQLQDIAIIISGAGIEKSNQKISSALATLDSKAQQYFYSTLKFRKRDNCDCCSLM